MLILQPGDIAKAEREIAVVICPTCNGLGRLPFHDPDGDGRAEMDGPCHRCDGTGKAK